MRDVICLSGEKQWADEDKLHMQALFFRFIFVYKTIIIYK